MGNVYKTGNYIAHKGDDRLKSIFFQISTKQIFILYLLIWSVRFINIDLPIFEGTSLRQVATASVIKFFFIEGISLENFFYPKMYRDEFNQYYLTEMPIYNVLVALACKIYGSYEEWIGRFVSILFSGLAGVYFYRFLSNNTSKRIAGIALLLYALSPLSIIYTRAIQPNPLMLFFLMATIYNLDNYLKKPQWKSFCLTSALGGTLFILNAALQVLGIFFLYMAFKIYNKRVFSNWKLYVMAISMLTPTWLWIIHGNNFLQNNLTGAPVVLGPINKEDLPFLSLSWITDYSFLKIQFEQISGVILTPIGFGMFVLGLCLLRKKDSVLIYWLISLSIFFVVINTQMHSHYYLPWIFPMVWVVANSISFVFDNLPAESFCRKGPYLSLLILLTVGIIAGYGNSGFIVPASVKMVPDAVESLNKYFPRDVFGIISTSDTAVLGYQVDRKVKVLGGNSGEEKVDAFRKILQRSDPKYYLSIYPYEDYNDRNVFSSFLRKNYTVAEYKKSNFVLYKIE